MILLNLAIEFDRWQYAVEIFGIDRIRFLYASVRQNACIAIKRDYYLLDLAPYVDSNRLFQKVCILTSSFGLSFFLVL